MHRRLNGLAWDGVYLGKVIMLCVAPSKGRELTPVSTRVAGMEQSESTNRVTGLKRRAGMIDEQVPVIWEVDVFMGSQQPPQGYVNFRYADGRDYSGYMLNGRPDGFGVMRGKVLSYVGIWSDGFFEEGTMVDAVRATEFRIPFQTLDEESRGAPDPQ